jgi:hypothetical protein
MEEGKRPLVVVISRGYIKELPVTKSESATKRRLNHLCHK